MNLKVQHLHLLLFFRLINRPRDHTLVMFLMICGSFFGRLLLELVPVASCALAKQVRHAVLFSLVACPCSSLLRLASGSSRRASRPCEAGAALCEAKRPASPSDARHGARRRVAWFTRQACQKAQRDSFFGQVVQKCFKPFENCAVHFVAGRRIWRESCTSQERRWKLLVLWSSALRTSMPKSRSG